MASFKIIAIVEKGADGMYAVYTNEHFGNSFLCGIGDSVEKAKDDFINSVLESINEQIKEKGEEYKFDNVDIDFRFDIPSFFNYYDFINVSKFAEYVGINESKMRAYKSGVTSPGEKTTAKIIKAVNKITQELSVTSFK